MAEPDPVAALAAQLEELRGQLARDTGETGYLRARLDEDSGQAALIRLEIKQLGGKLDDAISMRKVAGPRRGHGPACPRTSMRPSSPRSGSGSSGSPASSIPATWPGSRRAGRTTGKRSGNCLT